MAILVTSHIFVICDTHSMNNDLKVLHSNHAIIVHSGSVTFLSESFVMCSLGVISSIKCSLEEQVVNLLWTGMCSRALAL